MFPKANGKLKAKNANLIWLNLLLCDVEYLPSLKEIEYKLKAAFIEFENQQYSILKKTTKYLDGENYLVFVKNGKIENNFNFDNPNIYLKYYPKTDELISYKKILSVIRKGFNLWND